VSRKVILLLRMGVGVREWNGYGVRCVTSCARRFGCAGIAVLF
jgi:hypothetical protein